MWFTQKNLVLFLEGSDEDFSEDQEIHWIDEPEENELELARLVSAAVEFLEQELVSQEDLYDEDFED